MKLLSSSLILVHYFILFLYIEKQHISRSGVGMNLGEGMLEKGLLCVLN